MPPSQKHHDNSEEYNDSSATSSSDSESENNNESDDHVSFFADAFELDEEDPADANPDQSNVLGKVIWGLSFTPDQYHETKLLHILNQVNVSHFVYEDIMNWAQEAMEDSYDFQPKRKKEKVRSSTCNAG